MAKRGVINLVVEIDYEGMIPEEREEAILAFTGEKSRDGAMHAHLRVLGESLEKLVKEKPFIAYQLQGDVVESQVEDKPYVDIEVFPDEVVEVEVAEIEEDEEEDIDEEGYQKIISPLKDVIEKNDSKKLIEKLEDAILDVSMHYGIPHEIRMNGDMFKAVARSEDADEDMEYYKGFPIIREGMEELAIIIHKKYSDREIGEYSVS